MDHGRLEKPILVLSMLISAQEADQQHGSMDPTRLESTVQAGSGIVMVWGHFGPLNTNQHGLNSTVSLRIVADHVHLFMATSCHLLMATSSRIMTHVTRQKSSHEHDNEFSELQGPPQSPDLDPVDHLWELVEQEIDSMNVMQSSQYEPEPLIVRRNFDLNPSIS